MSRRLKSVGTAKPLEPRKNSVTGREIVCTLLAKIKKTLQSRFAIAALPSYGPGMHESVLRDFFTGTVSVEQLADDLRGALVKISRCVTRHPIVDMDADFSVSSSNMAALCDAFLAGKLGADDLHAIGFCLMASDHFTWDPDTSDGDRAAKVAHDWSCPEVNFPIDAEHVSRWKTYLETGVDRLRGGDAQH